jgi:hypothetical protein
VGFCYLEGAALGCYSQHDECFESGGIFVGVQAECKRAPFAGEAHCPAGAAFGQRFLGSRRKQAQRRPGLIGVGQAEGHGNLRYLR